MSGPASQFTLHGLQTLNWAVAEDEGGGVVQNLTITRKVDTKEVRNIAGDFCAAGSGFGRKGDLRFSMYKTTGVAANLGAALSVANSIIGNGIANEVVVLQSVADAMNNQDFVKEDVGGTLYDFGPGGT